MEKELKVFGGGWEGEERRIVATTSLTKALELTGGKRNFMCETANSLELDVALSNPGVVHGYNTRETKHPKTPADFKVIKAKNSKVSQQTVMGACDSGCGYAAKTWFLQTSVATCGGNKCVQIQTERWERHCST